MSIDFQLNVDQTPVQKIAHPMLAENNITLFVKRDDLTHPLISGNKWRKLKYNLHYAHKNKIHNLLSFSGAFSNHLYALAGASRLFGFNTEVIVRGPELDANNPCLKFASACGVKLTPVNRITYRKRYEQDYLSELQTQRPHSLIIPEGGSNQLAMKGVIELAQSLPPTDQVWCAVGSGGTLAGLIEGLPNSTQIYGVAVLKQANYLNDEIQKLSLKAKQQDNWHLFTEYHYGGYGKFTDELWQFCQSMRAQLPLEPIYTGKLLFTIFSQIKQGIIKPNTRIMAIHTGGLQGLTGLKYRKLI
ncbi:1-aminocyclopropane-1-carboxylate deaminase/D-cysteine desulfhydrase [Pseudoalteromonas spongiae]|uniref:1-aminocyclopropane-1-carboxylate deaminase/D-cysteine desulfhydrase n=1 Tax=Pseudoalteromonas spongiae TaxID=298657 RepID=UPI000C2CF60C|nr:pyridoxal-phosphate dependent enzyme [Pseudoalteromonas spongiae]